MSYTLDSIFSLLVLKAGGLCLEVWMFDVCWIKVGSWFVCVSILLFVCCRLSSTKLFDKTWKTKPQQLPT
jgi:hypothetical protein